MHAIRLSPVNPSTRPYHWQSLFAAPCRKGVASAFQSSGRVKAAASGALAFHGQQGEVHSTATPPSKTAPERMQPLEPVAMSGGGADEIR
eukprot:6190185-Pleurochrysis_carterae.AAC.1